MNNTILAVDANGNTIHALAPDSTTEVTLTASGASVLSANATNYRWVRLYTTATDCKIGVGTSLTAHMPVAAGIPETVKLEPNMNLYASGSGTLYITVMR